jgi:UDP-3-O-[3-hydroxymyristoyl] N-acetylglucosamine deacetylase
MTAQGNGLHTHQRTLKKPVPCTGIGVHSGNPVHLTIHPAHINHGIKFMRADLPGKPVISAHFRNVVDTSLATVIGQDGYILSTIEHLMASFYGMGIDNALVEVDTHEIPIMDGSAYPFAEAIRSTGIKTQGGTRYYFKVKEPISLSDGDRSVTVYPADTFQITSRISFDHPLINQQSLSLIITNGIFEKEVSHARTFGFYSDYNLLKQLGLSRGCSLDNVVVIDDNGVMNKDGLRYKDEFVRHKILDCLGDFSLLGMPLLGHIKTNKSGHALNHAFLKKFLSQKQSWETHVIAP